MNPHTGTMWATLARADPAVSARNYPQAMSEASELVWTEFAIRMNDLAGVHSLTAFSVFYLLLPWVDEQYANLAAPHPDSSLFIGTGDPNADGVAHLHWRFADLRGHLDPEIGTIPRALGQQWIVMVATEWGERYRKRFAVAEGVELNAIQDAGMADIHRMRNDVIHHGGVASKQNTGRCEVFKWFAPDDVIHPMMAHVAEFMSYLGLLHPSADLDGQGPWRVRGSSDTSI